MPSGEADKGPGEFEFDATVRKVRLWVAIWLALVTLVARPVSGGLGGNSFLAVCLLCPAGIGVYLFFKKPG